jgi:hypothetical protein
MKMNDGGSADGLRSARPTGRNHAPRIFPMRRILFPIAFLACAAAGGVMAQDEWTRGASNQLYLVLSRDDREGGHLLAPPATGVLYAEGIAEQTVRLEPGEHVIVGTCETACDLDLRAFDDAGTPVAADTDEHPHSLADLRVPRAGTYRVRAVMAACAAEPCRYAAGVFRIEP